MFFALSTFSVTCNKTSGIVDKKSLLVFNTNDENEQTVFTTPMGDIVLGPVTFTVSYLSGGDSIIQDVLLLSFLQVLPVNFQILQR